jgi:nucleoside-diphosphate-sugar epimerase
MKVLVNGTPGWLGNRFLEVLAKGFDGRQSPVDWSLRCLVLKGTDPAFIRSLSARKPIEVVEGDVTDPRTLEEAVRGVDVVFHLVGLIHPSRIRQLYEVNSIGTSNMLEASARGGVRRFVFISSNSVAGTNPDPRRLMTEDDPPRPYLNYGRSKYRAEQSVAEFHRSGRLETVILRPCWYYGPNQPERQTTFFRMIKKGNPILFGSGETLRSMSYVDNTCRAMLLAAESPKAAGQTYWIADKRPYTVNEIYSTVARLLGVRRFAPRRVPNLVSEACLAADVCLQAAGLYVKEIHVAGEMNKNIACSIEKAARELGYDPQIELEEGMRRSIAWCRERGFDV